MITRVTFQKGLIKGISGLSQIKNFFKVITIVKNPEWYSYVTMTEIISSSCFIHNFVTFTISTSQFITNNSSNCEDFHKALL